MTFMGDSTDSSMKRKIQINDEHMSNQPNKVCEQNGSELRGRLETNDVNNKTLESHKTNKTILEGSSANKLTQKVNFTTNKTTLEGRINNKTTLEGCTTNKTALAGSSANKATLETCTTNKTTLESRTNNKGTVVCHTSNKTTLEGHTTSEIPMETHIRDVLQENRTLLVSNIIPTDDLLELLESNKALSATMLQDIKALPSREEKNTKMIEMIPLRGKKGFEKFCDVLQLTGHHFLADYLREEGERHGKEPEYFDDLFISHPSLEKLLKAQEQDRLKHYLKNKVKQITLAYAWRSTGHEKEKAMGAKMQQLEQAWEHETVCKTKDVTIETLRETLDNTNKQLIEKTSEVKTLSRLLEDTKAKYEKDMRVQMRFNEANNKTLFAKNERQEWTDELLNKLKRKMLEKLKFNMEDESPDYINYNEKASTVEDFLNRILARLTHLEKIREKYQKLEDERKFVLMYIGTEITDGGSLADAFRDYVIKMDDACLSLKQEIERLKQSRSKTVTVNSQNKANLGDSLNFDASMKTEKIAMQFFTGTLQKQLKKLKEDNAILEKRLRESELEIEYLKHKTPVDNGPQNTQPATKERSESAPKSRQESPAKSPTERTVNLPLLNTNMTKPITAPLTRSDSFVVVDTSNMKTLDLKSKTADGTIAFHQRDAYNNSPRMRMPNMQGRYKQPIIHQDNGLGLNPHLPIRTKKGPSSKITRETKLQTIQPKTMAINTSHIFGNTIRKS
ncbi:unnamed protein product [Owenia fusiformis]|uniref:CARD domain-containing protein n=1 Tax=Owenia fusiformis TaxID=6347 RepID=A0A8S4NP81_OWEFU|nr:unnamed protein product [Owenia fusiformis]